MEDDFRPRQHVLQKPFQASRFLLTDNDLVVNEDHIVWIQRIHDCMHVCVKTDGCVAKKSTHKVCKDIQTTSFARLEPLFAKPS